MGHTKSAFACGGIHQQAFNQGLRAFFFSARRTVSSPTVSTISHSTKRCASSLIVHFAWPCGGLPQARATRCASASPSRSLCRRRTRVTVDTPTLSTDAISSSVADPSSCASSHASRMRAWVCLYAAVRPLDASAFNSICSSGDKRTRYFFADMVDPPCPLPTATGENTPTSQFNRGQVLAFRQSHPSPCTSPRRPLLGPVHSPLSAPPSIGSAPPATALQARPHVGD